MKNFTAWGIVVNDQLSAVYLEKYHAGRDLVYHKHKGKVFIVELQVTQESLKDIQKQLDKAQGEDQ